MSGGAVRGASPERESDSGPSNGGTPILAFDIGGTKLAAGLVVRGVIAAQATAPTPATAGPDAVVGELIALGRRLLTPGVEVQAIGVASAGLVTAGRVRALSPDLLPGWHGYPLAASLSHAFSLPVHALNDAQAAAYGEALHGAARGRRSSLFVTVSTGVGGGLVVDDELWQGASGMAGHIGHVRGRYLEQVTSGTAIARRAAALGRAADARAVTAAAAAGEAWAEELVATAAAALVEVLVDVRYLVDPEVVVLGGGVGLDPTFRAAALAAMGSVEESLRLELLPAELGAAAGLVGAAAWALRQRGRQA